MENSNIFDGMMGKVRTESAPSQLRITDLRITNIDGAPKALYPVKALYQSGADWIWGTSGRLQRHLCADVEEPAIRGESLQCRSLIPADSAIRRNVPARRRGFRCGNRASGPCGEGLWDSSFISF